MKTVAKPLALIALALTIGPAAVYMASNVWSDGGALGEGTLRAMMLVGTAIWFVAAPKWLHED